VTLQFFTINKSHPHPQDDIGGVRSARFAHTSNTTQKCLDSNNIYADNERNIS
jgi:hypothetical protein